MNSEKKVIFLHIPKTGGTSLRQLVDTQYPENQCLYLYYPSPYQPEVLAEIQAQLPSAKALYGHISFGIHELLGIEGQYIAFLRNPLQRVISLYNHHAREPEMPYYEAIKNGLSLLDMLQSEMTPETNNHMTRIIALNGQIGMLDDTQVLEQAIENINNYFCFMGLMEQFSESIALLAKKLNWRRNFYLIPHLLKNPRKRFKLDQPTQLALEKYNRLDLLLYDYVSQNVFPRQKKSKTRGCHQLI